MSNISLLLLLPLLGFLINSIVGRSLSHRTSGWIATLAVSGAFVQAVLLFFQMKESGSPLKEHLYQWVMLGETTFSATLELNTLSALFSLFITGIASLIHLYSIGYMSEEKGSYRFFAYLNLFIFFMLTLILADNLILLFVGWEGVGLCSYLLIGFYLNKDEAAKAGQKAFIVNRIGDFGFVIALMVFFAFLGGVSFSEILGGKSILEATPWALNLGLLGLLWATTAKSAQLPLYIWLPDAMEGPTPVSALIHAATMVTSGLYLIARLSELFILSPSIMQLIFFVGMLTALLAALMAITQTDIKKVLAYSTVSQLGYMFMAMGVGAFTSGVFHVLTHAFFKALLFLGAGAVIHSLHHEQNLCKMGGLRKKLPFTYLMMLCGTLAIAGIAPLSGFFSKDEILWHIWNSQWKPFWFVAWGTSLLTAFYMFRLFFLTFGGKSRLDPKKLLHVHESPYTMRIPLALLAVLAVFGGFVGIPHIFYAPHFLNLYFDGVFPEQFISGSAVEEIVLMASSVLGAVFAAWFAKSLYDTELNKVAHLQTKLVGLHRLLFNKFYVDELYQIVIVLPLRYFSKYILYKILDFFVINGIIVTFATFCKQSARGLQVVVGGSIQQYIMFFMLGAVVIGWYLIFI